MNGNDLFSLILMAAVLLGAALYIGRPLLAARQGDMLNDDYAETPMQHLLVRKDSIYTAMKDLEFDYTTGKMSEEDYAGLREKFAGQAAEVLKEIDDFSKTAKSPAAKGKKKAAAGSFCEACGFKAKPGDRFCQSCGAPVT